jgi:hypothetical protein
MKAYVLSNEESHAHGATHKVVITWLDLVLTAALTKTIAIYPFTGNAPIGTIVKSCKARVKTAFAGVTALVATVGDDGDVDRNLASSDMKATAGTWYAGPTTAPAPFNAVNTVDVIFTATTDTLVNLTVGEVEIYLQVYLDNRLAA